MQAYMYPLADRIAIELEAREMLLIKEIILQDDELEYFKLNYHAEMQVYLDLYEEEIICSFELGYF